MRPPEGVFEHMYDEAMYYYLFAKAFGWPPEVVDEQPVLYIEAMLVALAAQGEAQVDAQRAAARDRMRGMPHQPGR